MIVVWDVGQGDCSVLHLPTGEVILIDVGPRNSPVVDWLTRRPTLKIRSIVITHNDADHVGALAAIIDVCRSRIETVYILVDRPIKDDRFAKLFDRLHKAMQSGEIRLERLETPSNIWTDHDINCSLDLCYPNFTANVAAREPNDTAGVLTLSVANEVKMIWASDARIRTVAERCPRARPQHMIGPHHGAPKDHKEKEAVCWLRDIGPERVILSVGTKNPHGHPLPHYIHKIRWVGGRVVCTQLTKQCLKPREQLKDVVKSHALLGLPQPTTGVSCRGPIRLRLVNGSLLGDVDIDEMHARKIQHLSAA